MTGIVTAAEALLVAEVQGVQLLIARQPQLQFLGDPNRGSKHFLNPEP